MEFIKTYKTENLVIIGYRFFVFFQNFKVGTHLTHKDLFVKGSKQFDEIVIVSSTKRIH